MSKTFGLYSALLLAHRKGLFTECLLESELGSILSHHRESHHLYTQGPCAQSANSGFSKKVCLFVRSFHDDELCNSGKKSWSMNIFPAALLWSTVVMYCLRVFSCYTGRRAATVMSKLEIAFSTRADWKDQSREYQVTDEGPRFILINGTNMIILHHVLLSGFHLIGGLIFRAFALSTHTYLYFILGS